MINTKRLCDSLSTCASQKIPGIAVFSVELCHCRVLYLENQVGGPGNAKKQGPPLATLSSRDKLGASPLVYPMIPSADTDPA